MVTTRRGRSAITAVVAVAAMALAVAGCGTSSADEAEGTKSGSTEPGTAKIVAFEVPEATTCAETATFTSVSVSYETVGAARAELRVDGRALPLADPASGTVSADIRCDPLPHDFVLVAYDDDERFTVEQRMLNTTR